MKLFVATHNAHKIREISQILVGIDVIADDPEGVEETAPDFAGNALIKVHAIAARHPGEWCLADDSGLEVEALGGDPGVRSARYAGEPCDTPKNNALLLKNLAGVANRRARFTCCCALVDPAGEEFVVHGYCPGKIAEAAAGVEGFGYDPLFIPDGHTQSFAELSADEKNAISHRGRALEKVREVLGPVKKAARAGTVLTAWFRFFRIVNLPTVPGDVLVGAATAMLAAGAPRAPFRAIAAAAGASVCFYLYGLADNDIVGAATDRDRPIPDGAISRTAARLARGLCLLAALVLASVANLPPAWWVMASFLLLAAVLYNRERSPWLMGLCRGLNVACGVAVFGFTWFVSGSALGWTPLAAIVLWTFYIAAVTKFSEGEECDPLKKARVGFLIGGLLYLQLGALLALSFVSAAVNPLLIAGAVLLVLLRLFKRAFPKVSAS